MKCKNCGSTFGLEEAKIGAERFRRYCPTCSKPLRWGLNWTKIATGAAAILLLAGIARPSPVGIVAGMLVVMAFSLELKKT